MGDKDKPGGNATVIDAVGDGPPMEVAGAGPDRQAPSVAAVAARRDRSRTPNGYVAELEVEAATSIPDLTLPDGAQPEVVTVGKANVAVARAAWVRAKTKLVEPAKYGTVDPDTLNVGDVGLLRGTFEIMRVDSDAVVVWTARRQMFAFSGLNTSSLVTGRGLACDDLVECYRTGRFGVYTIPVVRIKPAGVSRDTFDEEADALANELEKKVLAERLDARMALTKVRDAAMKKALADASAKAARQAPVPNDGPGEVRIRAKLAFDKLEKKLQDEARARVEKLYAEPTVSKK
jgi:hypothetical protein